MANWHKNFIIACIVLFCTSVYAGMIINPFGTFGEGAGGGATDYTNDANCVAAYFMDDTGNELDDSGNGNTLTEASGTIPTSATVPAGYSGTSRDFESGDTEVLYQADGGGLDISGADQELTIACWVKFESDTSSDQNFFLKYTTTGDQRQILFKYDDADDVIEVILSGDGIAFTKMQSASGWSSWTTNWVHVAFVYNDTDIRIYIDGSLDGTPVAHTTGIYNGNYDACIGAASNTGFSDQLDGLMDELIFLDRALSPAEIAELVSDGISGDKGGSD